MTKEIKENNERIQAFIKDFGELRDKHKVDIAAWPMYVPNDKGTFDLKIQMQPIDISEQPTPSPFVA